MLSRRRSSRAGATWTPGGDACGSSSTAPTPANGSCPASCLMDEYQPRAVAADSAGPASRFVKQLTDAGRDIRTLTYDEYGQATEGLLEAVGEDGDLIQDGTDELRDRPPWPRSARTTACADSPATESGRSPRSSPLPLGLYAHEYPEPAAASIVL